MKCKEEEEEEGTKKERKQEGGKVTVTPVSPTISAWLYA
jgi:hypothetical protein